MDETAQNVGRFFFLLTMTPAPAQRQFWNAAPASEDSGARLLDNANQTAYGGRFMKWHGPVFSGPLLAACCYWVMLASGRKTMLKHRGKCLREIS
jgi:hypothetical protein